MQVHFSLLMKSCTTGIIPTFIFSAQCIKTITYIHHNIDKFIFLCFKSVFEEFKNEKHFDFNQQSGCLFSMIINIAFPVLSGVLAAVSFYSDKLFFVIFFALIPLMYSFSNDKKIYKIYLYSFFLNFFSYLWLYNISSRITSNLVLKIIISLLLISALSSVLSLLFTFPFITYRISKNPHLLYFPFLYIFGEWMQGIFPHVSLPWVRLGNVVSCFTAFIQTASLFGTLFVSFLIVSINALLSYAFLSRKVTVKSIAVITASFLFSINTLFGVQRLKGFEYSDLTAVIVQGNYPRESKFAASPNEIFDKYSELLDKSKIKNADLIIFPETVFHSNIYTNTLSREKLYMLSCKYNSLLLFGSQYKENKKYYNACMTILPNKQASAVYLKRKLVPFGEYNPFRFISSKFTATDFSQAEQTRLISSEYGLLGCSICFESIFPKDVSENVIKGAEAIAILTNDSWLGEKIPLYQHHSHSIMRAVENSRYVMTSTNTGISSVIDCNGKIASISKINTEYVISGNFQMKNELTFYTKYGDIIILPSCIIILWVFIGFYFQKVLKKKEN